MMTSSRTSALLLGLLLLPGATALFAQGEAALGSRGELYLAKAGAYAELFPNGKEADAAAPVLALEVARPGEPTQRYLVRGTESDAPEGPPFLLFAEASHTLFLAWETRINLIYPILMLTGFDGERWLAPIEITGNAMAAKTSPRLAVTHDTYALADDPPEQRRHRTILHVLWGEEVGASYATYYSPIILEDGAFVDLSPPYRLNLNDLDAAGGATAVAPELLQALRIQPGRDDQTVVAVFVSAPTGRAISVEIDTLPGQLSQLADDARLHIVDIGRRLSYPGHVQQIADRARLHIVDIGRRFFHREIAEAIGDQVRALIAGDNGAADLKSLADRARLHIVDIGAKLSGRGLRPMTSALEAQAQPKLVEIAGSSPAVSAAAPLAHFFQFRVAASWPVPETGEGAKSLLSSRTGGDLLIAWSKKDRVRYRVTEGDGWSEVRDILLSPAVDVKRAYEILEQQLESR